MDEGTWWGYSPWGHKDLDTTERLTLSLLLSIMPSSFTHVVPNGRIGLLVMTELYSIIYMHHISILASVDGHLGFLPVLATVSNSVMNMGGQISVPRY